MQRLDEAKRKAITKSAARMFAARPFHEVRLDDVAASAKISKGTVYLYFKNKDDLYDSLMHEGFVRLNDQLREQARDLSTNPWATFERMIRIFVTWAYENPHFFQLMRNANADRVRPKLKRLRVELGELFEDVLRRGVKAGEIDDPRPDITAQFIPAMVRSAFRHGPTDVPQEELSRQLLRVLSRGIREGET
jgi:AcrR family transcriptional regulator